MRVNAKCPVCGASNIFLLAQLHQGKLVVCGDCRLRFKHPMPDEETLESLYADEESHEDSEYYRGFRLKTYQKVLDYLSSDRDIASALDIGSGFGWFLELANERGIKSYGVEISDEKRKTYQRKNSKGVVVKNLDELPVDVRFDLITLFDVLEHIPDWRGLIESARYYLKDKDSWLVIRVPDTSSMLIRLIEYLYRLTGGKVNAPIERLYKYHVYGFNLKNLRMVLNKTSMVLIDYYRESGKNLKKLKRKIWARNLIVRVAIISIVKLAEVLQQEDELVLFARKCKK